MIVWGFRKVVVTVVAGLFGLSNAGAVESGRPRRRRFCRSSASRAVVGRVGVDLGEAVAVVRDEGEELISLLGGALSVVLEREEPRPWSRVLNLRFVAFMVVSQPLAGWQLGEWTRVICGVGRGNGEQLFSLAQANALDRSLVSRWYRG